jgi:membrane associated rhomboid family serine protease
LTPPPREGLSSPSQKQLRNFEIIAGLLLAAVLFIALKLIGMVLKFALIAALLGFGAGLLLARALRR